MMAGMRGKYMGHNHGTCFSTCVATCCDIFESMRSNLFVTANFLGIKQQVLLGQERFHD